MTKKNSNPLPNRVKDITGQVFGRLTVVEFACTENHRAVWLCRCSCGNEKTIANASLQSRKTKSCGCLRRDNKFSHGMSNTEEYSIWAAMLERCNNPSSQGYPNYGGRGIKVSKRWLSFENFIHDMGPRPKGKYSDGRAEYSIDRINNDGNYEPSNTRWSTGRVQQNNRRNNVNLTLDGVTFTVSQWSRRLGVNISTISDRIRRGWTVREALTAKLKKPNLHMFRGEMRTISGMSNITGVSVVNLNSRIYVLDWSAEKAVRTPIDKRFNSKRKKSADA